MTIRNLSIFAGKKELSENALPKISKPKYRLKGSNGKFIDVYGRSPERSDEDYKQLGKGSFGKVNLAWAGETQVALKSHEIADTAQDLQSRRNKIQQECKISLEVGIAITDAFVDINNGNKYYQIMHKFDDTLTQRMNNPANPLGPDDQLKIAIDLVLYVNGLHTGKLAKGTCYAHGDIKADNIMFDSNGKLFLIDYGLSARLEESNKMQDKHMVKATLYNTSELLPSLFNKAYFDQLPVVIQSALDWKTNYQCPHSLGTIAAMLIAFRLKPDVTENHVIHLVKDEPLKKFLIAQFKRERIINNLSEKQAELFLDRIKARINFCKKQQANNPAILGELQQLDRIINNSTITLQGTIIKLDRTVTSWRLNSDFSLKETSGIQWLFNRLYSLFRPHYLLSLGKEIKQIAPSIDLYRNKLNSSLQQNEAAVALLNCDELPSSRPY